MENTALLEDGEGRDENVRKYKFHHEVQQQLNEDAKRRHRLHLYLFIAIIVGSAILIITVVILRIIFV